MPDQLGLTWWCERKKQEGKNESMEERQKGGGEISAKQISAVSVVHTQTQIHTSAHSNHHAGSGTTYKQQ